ncbi:MAG: hypothetical protein H6599_03775 [Flavobacteriales bacterium]|nr:hypothetical protein [Flavobacteriales bacterium]
MAKQNIPNVFIPKSMQEGIYRVKRYNVYVGRDRGEYHIKDISYDQVQKMYSVSIK